MNHPFEFSSAVPENLSLDQWKEKLELARQKREQILAKSSEFYDQELNELYVSSALRFGANTDRQILFLKSGGNDYETMLKNYEKFIDFKNTQLMPVEKEMRDINSEINKIHNKEADDRNRQIEREEKEKFQADKDEIINTLYEALDSIYVKIPKEAFAVGMTTEMAIKTYLPELINKARQIEFFIKRTEEAQIPYDIKFIRRDLASEDLIKL